MSLTKKFLPSPRLDTHDESPLADGKNYRGGVRGKRLVLGIIFVCVLYLVVIGNLITLIVLASALRLDLRGSYYFSFAADNLLRVHASLLTDRILLDGNVTSDPPLSISSLSEVQFRGGTLLSDQAGIISQPSVLSVTRNSTRASDLVLRSNLGSPQLELLAGAVRLHPLLRAGEISASSVIQASAILTRNRSLLIRGNTANKFVGARGASLSTQTLLVSADNGSLSLQAPTINISAYDSVLLSGRQLTGSDDVRSTQLRLCACKDGALFLLSHASNNCRLRGPAGNLC